MIKAIIFDVGGVLVDLDMQACINAYRDILDFDVTAMLDASHQKGMFKELESGHISADEYRAYVLGRSRPGSEPWMVDKCMAALLVGMDPAKASLLNSLAGKYDLYILSNNNSISMPMCRDIMVRAGTDYDRIFKHEFLSYQMKVLKPAEEMFRRVIDHIGLAPSELLFIDDSASNTEAASALGMKTLLYIQGTSLESALRSLSGAGF